MRLSSTLRGSAFITLLLSYLAVFLLPLALGSILYTKTSNIMVENANRANLAMLEQLRQVMDIKLKDVEQISQQIAFNSRLQWLMSNADTAESSDAYKFVEFVSEHMSRYQNASDYIRDYYVYLGANDTVLLPSSKTTADTLFHRLYRPIGSDFNTWRSGLIDHPHYQDYIPVTYETPNSKLDTITFVQTLPLGELSALRGALVFLLDMNKVRSMLTPIEFAYQSSVFILDRENRLLVGNKDDALLWNQHQLASLKSGVPYEYEDQGVDKMLLHTVSERNGWNYVLVMPKDVYLEKVHTLKNWMMTLLLICLAGGGAAIVFWLHRNYTPLRDVVRVLQKEKPGRAALPANEYEFIRETIRMTIHEERELRHILSRQTPVIQASFLSRFVRGHVDVSRMTDESLRFMDIRLISESFAVILIDIADFSGFSNDQSERQWALVRFIISNVGNDLIRERAWGYSVELDQNRVALLINFYKERCAEASLVLDGIADGLMQVIEQRFKTYITIAIGDMHEGMERVGESYFEALSALDYKMYRDHSAIIRYREIAAADRHYYYPIETEMQLINFTKSGDVENVDKLIGNLFHAHFTQRRITPEMGRSLFNNMVSTLWKIINPMDPFYSEVFGEQFEPLKDLSACSTVDEMKVKIREWFLALCHYLNVSRTRNSRQLSERIAQYIEQHYGDEMLSLTIIAEQFELTPQYLSALFKKQMGLNLTDYVTRVRIDEAKKLMKDKKLTFMQIANKVGYASDIGFIRVFKKYEGTTPGKYRESL
ncbi:helix-turn-helix domain-containing protein [Paenibacillus allorhizosphaerae]|uniref:HTH-type transcriptional activator RhaR n=1 Tax=Paenibacillus allorhizosphaerae TaxID=2849866 RepID=A0ABN7TF78_9BACL|nr:helix-turn-helix domain-containing protein [Paenibacillus allorhizosphaerae]CAG7614438.1 HTH-type transcriptional activator RhaR [Paenibacillus allorhizosphaerae]